MYFWKDMPWSTGLCSAGTLAQRRVDKTEGESEVFEVRQQNMTESRIKPGYPNPQVSVLPTVSINQ